MKGVFGENKHTIDAKGRMTMPSKFRAALGEECYITRGLDGNLDVMSEEEFEIFSSRLLATKKTTAEIRMLRRQIYANTADATYDKQGRILIPQKLRDLAGLTKDVMVVGVGNKVEIWDFDRYTGIGELSDDDYATAYETYNNLEAETQV